MKHTVTMIICIVVILITGCQANTEQEETPNENEQADIENNEESDQPEEVDEVEEPEQDETNQEDESEVVEEESDREPKYVMNEIYGFEPIEDADEQVVLVTIDDVPDQNGLEMAETLAELDVPAIFFVNGHFVESEEKQEQLKRIHELGFAIGNHTYNHKNLTEISEEEQEEQILALNDLIEEVIGEKPKFFRAPHGANTDFARELVEQEGMLLMNWSFGYDFMPDYTNAEALSEVMVETELLTNGANLLMHDREWTSEALEDIILGLREKGYGFIHPDEILIDQ